MAYRDAIMNFLYFYIILCICYCFSHLIGLFSFHMIISLISFIYVHSVFTFMFFFDEGPTLETINFTFHIDSTPTFLYSDLYLNTAYTQHTTFIAQLSA